MSDKAKITAELALAGAQFGIDLISRIIKLAMDGQAWEPLASILPNETKLKVKLEIERAKTEEALREVIK